MLSRRAGRASGLGEDPTYARHSSNGCSSAGRSRRPSRSTSASPKTIALAVFASDAISSTAYATEEILFVIAVGAVEPRARARTRSSRSRSSSRSCSRSSSRRTARRSSPTRAAAAPTSSAARTSARSRRSSPARRCSSTTSSPSRCRSRPASPRSSRSRQFQRPRRRTASRSALVLIVLITLANLRGIKESGRIFAVPTYLYIVDRSARWSCYGLYRELRARRHRADPVRPDAFDGRRRRSSAARSASSCSCKGFSSGAVALTGVEAISNGVPAFRRPESKNAADHARVDGRRSSARCSSASRSSPTTSQPVPERARPTVFVADGHCRCSATAPCYVVLQFATAGDPRRSRPTPPTPTSRACRRSSPATATCPRQLANRGDRLVFSNGILVLAVVGRRADRRLRRHHQRADPALRGRRVHLVHAVAGGHGAPPPEGARAAAGKRNVVINARRRGRDAHRARSIVAITKFTERRLGPARRDPAHRAAVQGDQARTTHGVATGLRGRRPTTSRAA